jgi:hypothetical protein
VKARCVGVCPRLRPYTQRRNGKGDAYRYDKRCHPGGIERRWARETVRECATRPWPRRAPSRRTRSANQASGHNTRARETLELVRARPGITIPQLADAVEIQPKLSLPGAAATCVRGSGQERRSGLAPGTAPATSATTRPATVTNAASDLAMPTTRAKLERSRQPRIGETHAHSEEAHDPQAGHPFDQPCAGFSSSRHPPGARAADRSRGKAPRGCRRGPSAARRGHGARRAGCLQGADPDGERAPSRRAENEQADAHGLRQAARCRHT